MAHDFLNSFHGGNGRFVSMHTLRYLYGLLTIVISSIAAHAHDRFEGTIDIRASDECLELIVIVPSATVSGLLKSNDNSLLTRDTLAAHRSALLSTADKLCLLEDNASKPLQPARIQLSVGDNGEVCYLLEYPFDARPFTLKVALLAMLPSPHFFVVTDHRGKAPRSAVLVRDHSSFDMTDVASKKSP